MKTVQNRSFMDDQITVKNTNYSIPSGYNPIYVSPWNREVEGTRFNDYIVGSQGNDDIDAEKGNDIVYGGAGHDEIDGDEGNDELYGQEGNDQIDGGAGNDTLVGGTGNDYLEGNEGSDLYIFSRGDGQDIIDDDDDKFWSSSSSIDTIQFNDTASSEVKYSVSGKNLIINYGTNDVVTIRNFQTSKGKIEAFKFTDRSLTYADVMNEINSGNGNSGGENPNVNLPGNPGSKNKIIGTDWNDELKGTSRDDYIYGGKGNDDIEGKYGNDTIYGGAGHDEIDGDEGNDELYGQEGNDQIEGEKGNDILVGGRGNDYLEGNEGNDTYIFSRGDGFDVVYDNDRSWNAYFSTDTIKFTDVKLSEATFRLNGQNLTIQYGQNDLISVQRFKGTVGRIEQFQFADQTLSYRDINRLLSQNNKILSNSQKSSYAVDTSDQELNNMLNAISTFEVSSAKGISTDLNDASNTNSPVIQLLAPSSL